MIVLLLFVTTSVSCFGQKFSTKIDTVYYSPDSTVVFVQDYVDSILHQSYFGSWTGLTSTEEYWCGTFRLRKCISTIEHLSHIWDKKTFDLPEGVFRGCYPLGEPAILSMRRKK